MTLAASYRGRAAVYAVIFLLVTGFIAAGAAIRQSASFLFLWGILNAVLVLIGFIVYMQRESTFIVAILLYGWVYITTAIVNVIFTAFLVYNCVIAQQSCPGVDAGFGLVFDFVILLVSLIFSALFQDVLLKLSNIKMKET